MGVIVKVDEGTGLGHRVTVNEPERLFQRKEAPTCSDVVGRLLASCSHSFILALRVGAKLSAHSVLRLVGRVADWSPMNRFCRLV